MEEPGRSRPQYDDTQTLKIHGRRTIISINTHSTHIRKNVGGYGMILKILLSIIQPGLPSEVPDTAVAAPLLPWMVTGPASNSLNKNRVWQLSANHFSIQLAGISNNCTPWIAGVLNLPYVKMVFRNVLNLYLYLSSEREPVTGSSMSM